MTMTATCELVFLPPARLMSMNDRDHWRAKAKMTKLWRAAAHGAVALDHPGASQWLGTGQSRAPSIVHIVFPVRDRRRRDPHNYYPTVKAIVDGLVDAGVWPDDTPEWVTTTEPTLTTSALAVTITITDRAAS